eukprot:jgi/Hompol1/2944/HPOL_006267-RA
MRAFKYSKQDDKTVNDEIAVEAALLITLFGWSTVETIQQLDLELPHVFDSIAQMIVDLSLEPTTTTGIVLKALFINFASVLNAPRCDVLMQRIADTVSLDMKKSVK